MLLFRRLDNFKRAFLARLTDKRRAERYPVGPDFPLKATVSLIGSADPGRVSQKADGDGRDWSGRLVNFSATGVSLQLPSAAVTVRGEKTQLALFLEMHRLEIPAEVAHFRVFNTHSICGLRLCFDDDTQQTAYLQLLEAVIIGASLKPWIPSGLVRNPPGLVRERYRSDNDAVLCVWRQAKTRQVDSFELRIHDHLFRGELARPGVEIYTRQDSRAGKVALSAAGFYLSAGEHAEARRLFRWVAPNLSRELTADARKFVQGYAVFSTGWTRPPVRVEVLKLR